MPTNYDENGVLRELLDDTTEKVYTYANDGTQIGVRNYTPAELAEKQARVAEQAIQADAATRRLMVKQIVTDLKTEKDRLDVVLAKSPAQITGGDTKDVARASKRIADAAIDIARLLTE